MTKKAEYAKKRRDSLFARGLCIRCGKNPARPGLKECEECVKKRDLSRKRYIANMPREKYETMLARNTEYTMNRYYKLKEQGLCVKCGRIKVNGVTLCDGCKKKIKEQERRRRLDAKRGNHSDRKGMSDTDD